MQISEQSWCRTRRRTVYGKMKCRMEKIESQVLPIPPNTIASLRAGFDAVANHIVVIAIPIAIDLWLWLGPHLQVKSLLTGLLELVMPAQAVSAAPASELYTSSLEMLRTFFGQFNLISLLRTIPVGIPSLMAFKLPVEIPAGSPAFVDITNPIVVGMLVVGLLLAGLVAGSLFYSLVTQVSLHGKLDIRLVIKNWWWSSVQVVSLALALIILYIVVTVPSSCAIYAITLLGLPFGQFTFFLYFAVMLWLAFPLIFSAHGIFVNHNNALVSVQRSMVLTRMTLPTTAVFFLSILAISEGLDILWRVPSDNSWLTIIGVSGHAFIASALLAASFIYYRDADNWTQETLRLMKSPKETPIQSR
jgi:hypothetical protein